MKRRYAILAALISATAAIARAEDTTTAATAAPQTIEERLNALEQRNAILERKYENAQEAAAGRTTTGTTVNAGKDGFNIKSNDGAFNLKISALIQTDYRDYFHDHGATQFNDQFLVRRIRPTFEGTVSDVVSFRITPDFANGGGTTAGPTSTLLPDAWVELQYLSWAKLRFGKFKSPVGLEELQSDPFSFSLNAASRRSSYPIATPAFSWAATSKTARFHIRPPS